MVLVGNCFITKVPHILPVKEGERVFPVRIQIVFQTKISEEGIIFDPMDLGDGFCSFFSNGQCPPAIQQGSTFPIVPTTLPHVPINDKRRLSTSVLAGDMPPSLNFGSPAPSIVSHQRGNTLVPSFRCPKSSNLANLGQAMNSAIIKFASEADTSILESDPSNKVKSHQSHLISAVRNPADSRASQDRKENLSSTEKASMTHFVDLCNKTFKHSPAKVDRSVPAEDFSLHSLGKSALPGTFLGTVDMLSELTQDSSPTVQKLHYCLDAQKNLVNNMNNIHSESSLESIMLATSAAESDLAHSRAREILTQKKDSKTGWSSFANPPVVFKRRKMSMKHGQGKAGLTLNQQNNLAQGKGIQTDIGQNDKTGKEVQKDMGQHGGKVLSNLGLLNEM